MFLQQTNNAKALLIRKTLQSLIVLASAISISACAIPRLQFPGVYKVDIQQGNIITQATPSIKIAGITSIATSQAAASAARKA